MERVSATSSMKERIAPSLFARTYALAMAHVRSQQDRVPAPSPGAHLIVPSRNALGSTDLSVAVSIAAFAPQKEAD